MAIIVRCEGVFSSSVFKRSNSVSKLLPTDRKADNARQSGKTAVSLVLKMAHSAAMVRQRSSHGPRVSYCRRDEAGQWRKKILRKNDVECRLGGVDRHFGIVQRRGRLRRHS